jgi:hypothetical protein
MTALFVIMSLALGAIPCAAPAPMPAASRGCCMPACDEMTVPRDAGARPAPVPIDCCVVAAGRDVAVLTPVATVQVHWRALVPAAPAIDMPAATPAPANDRAALARSAPRSAPPTALLI